VATLLGSKPGSLPRTPLASTDSAAIVSSNVPPSCGFQVRLDSDASSMPASVSICWLATSAIVSQSFGRPNWSPSGVFHRSTRPGKYWEVSTASAAM
jgi:hypothetical protein